MDHRFLLALGDSLRALRAPEAIIASASGMLGRQLHCARAGYGEMEPGTDLMEVVRDWTRPGMSSVAGRLRVIQAFGPALVRVLRAGNTAVVRDCRTDPRSNDPEYLRNWDAVDVRAIIAVPLIRDGRIAAIAWVHEQGPREWTEDEVALCEEVAGRTWDSLERARAEIALRESFDHYRATVDLNPQVPWTAEPDGVLDHVASRWLTLTGTTGLHGTWAQAIHPDDLDRTFELWNRSTSSGHDYDVEHRVLMRDGRYGWMRSRAYARRDAAGRIVKWYGFTESIDDRKRFELLLRDETSALETLNNVAIALTSQHDLAAIATQVIEAGIGLCRADFGVFAHRASGAPDGWRTACAGAPPADMPLWTTAPSGPLLDDTFRDVEIARRHDLSHDATLDGSWLRRAGVRSWLAIPVVSRNGEVLGGLMFGHADPHRFNAHAERLVEGIAAHAAIAIDNGGLLAAVSTELDQRVLAETRLRALNETLEQRVEQVIDEREQAQDALRQAQKMEAVGQLTGGIAHDFNNLLTGIIGSLDLLDRRIGAGRLDNLTRYTSGALASARRAAGLTQRLLAFARRQSLDPKPVLVNAMVASMEELIRRTVGEGIELRTALANGSWATRCDVNQLESALLNVCINARDAMPDGGRITIETSNAHLDEHYATQARDVAAGPYVLLSISDTGEGMSPDVLERAFEPFFTTKPIGKGTGLGLSQLYGFIKQSGGHVTLESTPGRGTTVRVYLPRQFGIDDVASTQPREKFVAPKRSETVLLVEDEDMVRALVVDMLEDQGLRVVEARDAEAALRVLEGGETIDLLVSDIGLPGMNGRDLADRIRVDRPALPVLFITGYPHDARIDPASLDDAMRVLPKPFTVDQFSTRVDELLASIEPHRLTP